MRLEMGSAKSWWRHQIFSALLALCAGNSPVTGEFPSQKPVTRSFDIFFGLRLNKRSSKQSRRRRFETPSRSLWHHCNMVGILSGFHVFIYNWLSPFFFRCESIGSTDLTALAAGLSENSSLGELWVSHNQLTDSAAFTEKLATALKVIVKI